MSREHRHLLMMVAVAVLVALSYSGMLDPRAAQAMREMRERSKTKGEK